MGCGASFKRPANDEQKREMFHWASREMMDRTGKHAISNVDQISIKAPDVAVGKFRDMATSCLELGATLSEKSEGAGDAAAALAGKAAGAGFLGGMMRMAADAVDKAGELMGAAASKPFELAAAGLNEACDKVDEKFASIGHDLAEGKKGEIEEALMKVIRECTIETPVALVRGAAPHGPEEHKAVDPAACSAYVVGVAQASIDEQLKQTVAENMQKSKSVMAWKGLIDNYNAANQKIGEMGELGAKFRREPVALNIEDYIVEQVRMELGKMMGAKEAELREAAAGEAGTFALCFHDATKENYVAYSDITVGQYHEFRERPQTN